MESIFSTISGAISQLSYLGIADLFDILIIAFILYRFLGFVRKSSISRFASGILIILLALWISGELQLNVINFLLRNAVELGLLALVILFQPELRRALEKFGTGAISGLISRDKKAFSMDAAITQTVIACTDMSSTRTGSLLIFERGNKLSEQIGTGTKIDADATSELIKNIFFPNAPLHDGAVIVRDGRIIAAGCMLPLSTNANLSRELGMRHRAGIGMSEQSDAVVVMTSEETGSISVAVDGMLKRHLSPDTFERLLRNELMPESDDISGTSRISKIFKVKKHGEEKKDK